IIELEHKGLEPVYDVLISEIEGELERQLLPGLIMSDLAWAGGDDFDVLFKKATEALSSLRRRKLEKQLEAIQIELGEAERAADPDSVLRLFQEKADIKRKMLQSMRT
ncbi:MAG: hypothetical protein ACREDR_43720, partial [Blastocatellia bacterium]